MRRPVTPLEWKPRDPKVTVLRPEPKPAPPPVESGKIAPAGPALLAFVAMRWAA